MLHWEGASGTSVAIGGKGMDAQFLNQYENELAYLRQTGSEFAHRFPTLAGKLGMDEFHCSDPFVERLLEGFAFLTARVHRRLDAEFPKFTTSLLDAVFPLATRPVPSAGIFRIEPILDEGSLLAGYTLPRGTRLLSGPAPRAQTGCRFDLTDDVQLWPLKIADVQLISREQTSPQPLPAMFQDASIRSVLLIKLSMTVAAPVSALPLDSLRIHLRGGEVAPLLLEYLLAHAHLTAVQTADSQGLTDWTIFDGAIRSVGFDANQSLFPHDDRVFSGHQLLQEYFTLPEKFMFVDLGGLRQPLSTAMTGTVQIAIGFDQSSPRLVGRVAPEHLNLFCGPAVNLFKKRSDRVWLDHTQHEHHLIADRSRVSDYEIWSVDQVALHSTLNDREAACRPLYAGQPNIEYRDSNGLLYSIERKPRRSDQSGHNRSAYSGCDVWISLSDSGRSPRMEEFQQLAATTYCTNRDLPMLVPECGWRDAFQVEAAGPIAKVTCVTGPTEPRPALAAEQGESTWRLINHLTPGYLSLTGPGVDSCAMLRDLLQLFCPGDNRAALKQIDGVQSLGHRTAVRRVGSHGPITYARGIEIELVCDEQAYEGHTAFLLGSVLEQYLARYVTLNSFVELHLLSTQRGNIHRWAPRCGTTPLV